MGRAADLGRLRARTVHPDSGSRLDRNAPRVTRLEITPFADEHLDGAAILLAERHRVHRAWSPLLDASYEQRAAAREAIEREWRQKGASGAAALQDGTLAGYLIAAPQPGEAWGANVLVGSAGAAAGDPRPVRRRRAAMGRRGPSPALCAHPGRARGMAGRLVAAVVRLSAGA